MGASGGDPNAELRKWVVGVLLALLAFVTVFGAIDRSFHADIGLYGLMAGVVTGLFGAAVVGIIKRRNDGEE